MSLRPEKRTYVFVYGHGLSHKLKMLPDQDYFRGMWKRRFAHVQLVSTVL